MPGHTIVFVRQLRLGAHIGVHAHEHGRTQPLMVDIEVEVVDPGDRLAETLDYTVLADKARTLAEGGHFQLAETFAARLAEACLEDPRAFGVKVTVEKPEALAPDAAGAGARVSLWKGQVEPWP